MSSRLPVTLAYEDADERERLKRCLGKLNCKVSAQASLDDDYLLKNLASPGLLVVHFSLWRRDEWTFCGINSQSQKSQSALVILGNEQLFNAVSQGHCQADEYIRTPADETEFIARIGGVLQKLATGNSEKTACLRFADISFDIGKLEISSASGTTSILTAAEAKLLLRFLRSPNRVLTREQLMQANCADDESFERSVDVLVSRLRKKLESNNEAPRLIRTIYGIGYLFSADVKEFD